MVIFYKEGTFMNTILKSQSGRSMVEMLGVLAIIGVLSVGGIAGYRQAMLQKNLNDIAQGVSLALIEAKRDLEQTGEYRGDVFETDIGNYKISARTWDGSYFFSPRSEIAIFAYRLSKEVCEALCDQRIPFENLGIKGWTINNVYPIVYPNIGSWTCGESNTLSLYF